MSVIKVLQDEAEVDIVNMNASWESKAYAMGDNLHLCVHLFWDNLTPTGTMTLEYSGDPIANGSNPVENWVAKDITNIDGSFEELMYLDANLPISAFRLRFSHTGGSANLKTFIVQKKGK